MSLVRERTGGRGLPLIIVVVIVSSARVVVVVIIIITTSSSRIRASATRSVMLRDAEIGLPQWLLLIFNYRNVVPPVE